MNTLGIVAGKGRLPLFAIEACQKQGRPFFVIALKNHAEEDVIPKDVPQVWIRLGAVGKAFDAAHKAGVRDVLMVGAVRRPSLIELCPDWKGLKFITKAGVKALGDDGLLKSILSEVEKEGFHVIGVDQVLDNLVAVKGVYGKIEPDKHAWEDIKKGYHVAKIIGEADVGQGVIVADGLVLGVEAIEGTDALIERCEHLRRKGSKGILVKVKKPNQEHRIDLPAIGVTTVLNAAKHGLRGIAVEKGAALVLDREEVIKQANKHKIFVVGVDETCLKKS